ncbi:hypothetical protein Kalk_16110 [Ketobacter alkanivorans]|uniref:Uncharacterized protein n=1 Tax=Ketobacter alkanivorans TaxID=1917421 RepID=A0A2K9LNB2_9GAMM|nr:hypothetical protein Kalk_16110 [Ketobacter alkanivorans]
MWLKSKKGKPFDFPLRFMLIIVFIEALFFSDWARRPSLVPTLIVVFLRSVFVFIIAFLIFIVLLFYWWLRQ